MPEMKMVKLLFTLLPMHGSNSVSKDVTVSLKLVKLLIEKGAPIDAKNQDEDTPLLGSIS